MSASRATHVFPVESAAKSWPGFFDALAAFGLGGRPQDLRRVRRGYCASCGLGWIWWAASVAGSTLRTRRCPAERCKSILPLARTTFNRRPRNGWRWWPGTVAP